jgi:hypothetical protein
MLNAGKNTSDPFFRRFAEARIGKNESTRRIRHVGMNRDFLCGRTISILLVSNQKDIQLSREFDRYSFDSLALVSSSDAIGTFTREAPFSSARGSSTNASENPRSLAAVSINASPSMVAIRAAASDPEYRNSGIQMPCEGRDGDENSLKRPPDSLHMHGERKVSTCRAVLHANCSCFSAPRYKRWGNWRLIGMLFSGLLSC